MLCVLAPLLLSACAQSSRVVQQSVSSSNRAGPTVYVDRIHNVHVSYPSDWQVSQGYAGGTQFDAATPNGTHVFVLLNIKDLGKRPAGESVAWKKRIEEERRFERTQADRLQFLEDRDTTLNGFPAHRFLSAYRHNGQGRYDGGRDLTVIVHMGTTAVTLSSFTERTWQPGVDPADLNIDTGAEQLYREYEPTFESMLQSLRPSQ